MNYQDIQEIDVKSLGGITVDHLKHKIYFSDIKGGNFLQGAESAIDLPQHLAALSKSGLDLLRFPRRIHRPNRDGYLDKQTEYINPELITAFSASAAFIDDDSGRLFHRAYLEVAEFGGFGTLALSEEELRVIREKLNDMAFLSVDADQAARAHLRPGFSMVDPAAITTVEQEGPLVTVHFGERDAIKFEPPNPAAADREKLMAAFARTLAGQAWLQETEPGRFARLAQTPPELKP